MGFIGVKTKPIIISLSKFYYYNLMYLFLICLSILQVLVGHSDIVTCVAVSITNKTQVVSGSWDYNLIVWDINTGSDVHLLSGHLGKVTCVKVTGDGSIAVSGKFVVRSISDHTLNYLGKKIRFRPRKFMVNLLFYYHTCESI